MTNSTQKLKRWGLGALATASLFIGVTLLGASQGSHQVKVHADQVTTVKSQVVNKVGLQKEIEGAKAYSAKDYQPAAFNTFEQVITWVENIANDSNASQAQIDEALYVLQKMKLVWLNTVL